MKHSTTILLLLIIVACSNHYALAKSRSNQFDKKPLAVLYNKETASVSAIPRGGDNNKPKIKGGDATVAGSVFNLVNNVAGAGILTLSAGMASGTSTGWIPSILACIVLGIISSHTFCMVGKACELTNEVDFKGLWARTISPHTTYLVDSITTIMCLAAAVIYSGILGDVFTPLLKSAGLSDALNGRTSNILIITLVALLPMSLIKNLSALAFTSILGFSAIMYTVLFILVRSLDGTYNLQTGGKFVVDGMITPPAFQRTSLWNCGLSSLVLCSNLSLAFVAHYNAPAYYRELKETSSKKFGGMVSIGFVILTLLYSTVMTAGYSTFGDVTQGNILLSYHPKDILSTLGRVATGFSILFGFPLVAAGAREGVTGFCNGLGIMKGVGDERNHFMLVASILTFCTLISTTVQDVSLVVGLTGAVMGSLIVYIIPAIIYIRAVGVVQGVDSDEYVRAKRNNSLLIPFGVASAILGVRMTLKA